MSADTFLQYLTQAFYVAIFVVTLVGAVRRPLRARIDIALFFGAAALVITAGWVAAALNSEPPPVVRAVTTSLVMVLPYLLLRLVNDFTIVPSWLLRVAEGGLALAVVGIFLFTPELPAWLVVLLALYFSLFSIYSAIVFFRESQRTSGVTRRRMQAVSAGSGFLGLALLLAGVNAAVPVIAEFATLLVQRPLTLASGVAYFVGFAPPAVLRRAWQEPELRVFLGRAARLPRLPDTTAIVRELERGAASSLGAPDASIGLWAEPEQALRFTDKVSGGPFDLPSGQMIAGQAFARQEPIFSVDVARDDPGYAETYRRYGTNAALAAPITAGDKRLGVLVVYAPKAPVFVEEDLHLVQLLADQAAVVLESRALIDEAMRVRAREEVTRLKDDFLSAAAHDLKTPLTTLVALGQLLELHAQRDPSAPADLGRIQRLVTEAIRLKNLVLELLDASRVEQGRILGSRQQFDLVELSREVCARQISDQHSFVIDAEGPVIGEWDRTRISQLIENLVENAVKYSPDGGEVRVRVWQQDAEAHLSVTDRGIGIPPDDMPRLFERFHRGTNVDDRHFSGMGLGLFICRGIVEQHGGRIEATSTVGQGTTFHVSVPRLAHEAKLAGATGPGNVTLDRGSGVLSNDQ